MAFIDINKMAARETFPGFSGKFIHASGFTIAHWEIKAGSSAPVHTHVHEQTVDVIKGRLEMTIDGEVIVLEPGQGALIPSMVPHGARALTDVFVIDTFCPVREDYK
jgi:quercetin dioxygenase-like cupin family protein